MIERTTPPPAPRQILRLAQRQLPRYGCYFRLRIEALEHYRAPKPSTSAGPAVRRVALVEDEGADFDRHGPCWRALTTATWLTERYALALGEIPRKACTPPVKRVVADMTRWMLDFAAGEGATVQLGSGVECLLTEGERCVGVRTALGEHRADQVCLAAGVLTSNLLHEVGFDLPMQNAAGLILASQPQPPILDQIIMSPDVHFRQDPDGTIRMGEIFSGAFEAGRDVPALAQTVIERVRARLSTPEPLRLAHSLVGTRPVPADGFPAVGGIAGGGLVVAAIQSGHRPADR